MNMKQGIFESDQHFKERRDAMASLVNPAPVPPAVPAPPPPTIEDTTAPPVVTPPVIEAAPAAPPPVKDDMSDTPFPNEGEAPDAFVNRLAELGWDKQLWRVAITEKRAALPEPQQLAVDAVLALLDDPSQAASEGKGS